MEGLKGEVTFTMGESSRLLTACRNLVGDVITIRVPMILFGMFGGWFPSLQAQTHLMGEPPLPLGQEVYQSYCAGCHGKRMPRAPHVSLLQKMTAESVVSALSQGVMQEQGKSLSEKQRQAVAEYLSGRRIGEANIDPQLPSCNGFAFDRSIQPHARGWGLDYKNTRFQTMTQAGLGETALERLEIAWSITFPYTIQMRSQPAFAGGFLYMGTQNGTVYALDAETGCLHWKFNAISEVRTSITVSPWAEGDSDMEPVIVFGDYVGNIYGLSAVSGKMIWKVRPHEHPHAAITGSPRILNNRVFVSVSSHEDVSAAREDYPCCTFQGAVASLDLHTGKTIWLTRTIAEKPIVRGLSAVGTEKYGSAGASVWNSPSIDTKRNQLYVGTGDNYAGPATPTSDSVIAMDLDSGKINWVYQATEGDLWNTACMVDFRGPNCPEPEGPDYDIGAGIVLASGSSGRDMIIAGQKSGIAYGIDPDRGELVWKNELGRGGIQGGIHFGLAAADATVFVPVSDMEYSGDAAVYTKSPRPGLYALDVDSGKIKWSWEATEDLCNGREYCDPGISAPPTVIGNYVIVGALDGWLRVHHRTSGKLVWSMDTTRELTGINNIKGNGGSMNGVGPIAYGGRIYVPSGYAFAGHMPGNVLIVLKEK